MKLKKKNVGWAVIVAAVAGAIVIPTQGNASVARTTSGAPHPQPYVAPHVSVKEIPTDTYYLTWKGYTDPSHTWFVLREYDYDGWAHPVVTGSLSSINENYYVTLTDGRTATVETVGPQGVQEVSLP